MLTILFKTDIIIVIEESVLCRKICQILLPFVLPILIPSTGSLSEFRNSPFAPTLNDDDSATVDPERKDSYRR